MDRLTDLVPPPRKHWPEAHRPASGALVQAHDDRHVFKSSPEELPAIDIKSL